MPTDQILNFAGDERAGFRLERLEVLNWGTFHQRVATLDVEGHTALLTGVNRGGKSTLVDALLTLLVPHRMSRNYNMDSGATKRERTERTYIRGVWGEEFAAEGSDVLRAKKLRPKPGTPSVLLAVFRNRATHQIVTLAQVLWEAGEDVQHLFICTTDERSIMRDFHDLGDPSKLRQLLAKRGMEPYPSFDAYAETLCRRLHISFPDGLGLFNQVVSVKETGDIAQFVREHMLTRLSSIDETLASAQQQLEDLERCAADISTAKQQLTLLKPIVEHHGALTTAKAEAKAVDELHEAVPLFFATTARGQAAARMTAITEEEAKLLTLTGQLETKKSALDAQRVTAIQALAGLPEAQTLKRLNEEIEAASTLRTDKEAARKRFDACLRDSGLREVVRSAVDFQTLRAKISSNVSAQKGQHVEAIRKGSELRRQAGEKRREQGAKLQQVSALKNSHSHIRGDLIATREALSRATGIPIQRLPFTGELIEVKAEHAAKWKESIEILLHGFGLSMLVLEQDYRAVVQYLHAHNIRGLLDFNRIAEVLPTSLAEAKVGDFGVPGAPTRVISMLNLRQDHHLRGNIAEEIRRRFPHLCCLTDEEFRKHDYAITATRLQRNGPVRHRKDDRPKSMDPENFVLGWNNEDLLRTLEQRAAALGVEAQKLEEQAARADATMNAASTNLESLNLLNRFEHYDQICADAEIQAILNLNKTLKDLQRSNDRLRTLEGQRQDAEHALKLVEEDLKKVAEARGGFTKERAAILRVEKDATAKLAGKDFDPDKYAARLRVYLGKRSITLENAASLESELSSTLLQAFRTRAAAVTAITRDLTSAMTNFLIAYQEFKTDFAAKEDKVGDYLALQTRIEKERLPELEDRFRRLMSERVVQDMALLRNKLTESVDTYKGAIAMLNQSLAEIEYNADTFIQLVTLDARVASVAQFKNDLKACLPGAVNPTDETRRAAFDKIREVLGKLRTEEKWRRYVLDTRNWLEFRVDEKNRVSGAISPVSTSAAHSGGQKTKLAFSVLAASISHHYGLMRQNADAKSFRFVVIDEIFGKLDEPNATYALKLFQKFKLQLLIVCPFTAQARVVDDYVGSFHLAVNPEFNNSRLMRATLEQVNSARASEPLKA